jgi:DNA (cytosine-5)-methyltransferase 1
VLHRSLVRLREAAQSEGEVIQSSRPIAIDLFAGAGGLSLGLERAGFELVAAVEYDPIHAAIHELNFPRTKVVCEDVRNLTELTVDQLRELLGVGATDIDLIAGGPPCQGFSLIGHRILDDPRNSLVIDFFTIVDALRPKVFLIENVPGMASGNHNQFLNELVERFEQIGYEIRKPVQILNAANFGVPQNRRRLFLIGARSGVPLPIYPAPMFGLRGVKSTSGVKNGNRSCSMPPGPSVIDALGDLPEIEDFPELLSTDVLRLSEPLVSGSTYAQRLRCEMDDLTDFSYPRKHEELSLTGCLRARHTDLSRSRFAATLPGQTEPVSRFFRLPPDGLSNTLRAGTGSERGAFTAPRPIHPFKARCISVREAARLHSFPDWFRFHRSIWHGFRQIGNAVPPLLGQALGSSIITALDINPVKPSQTLLPGLPMLAQFDMSDASNYFGVSRQRIPGRTRRSARSDLDHSIQIPLVPTSSEGAAIK